MSELGVPTSVDLVSCEPAHMVTSFTSGHIGLFDLETQQLVLTLESAGPPGKAKASFLSDVISWAPSFLSLTSH